MRRKFVLPVFVALVVCGVLLVVADQVNRVMDIPDYLVMWASGNVILHGQSPYDPAAWHARVNVIDWPFPYPLPTGIFFVPWGALPYRYSYFLWMFLCAALIVASALIALASSRKDGAARFLVPVLTGLIIFRPVLVSIRNGQIGGLLLFILVIATLAFERKRYWLAGLILALELLKPTIGLPLIAGYAFFFLVRQNWKSLAGLGVGGLVFMASGFALDLRWVVEFLSVGNQKLQSTFGYSPTVWGMADMLCGSQLTCTWLVGGLGSLVIVLVTLGLIWRARDELWKVASLVSLLPLSVSPYAWAYEQVLLVLPIIFIILMTARSGWSFLASGVIFPLFSLVSVILLLVASSLGHDSLSFLLPLACFLWIALFATPEQQSEPA